MQFETLLNLAWLMLGAVSLGYTTHSVLRREKQKNRAPAWLHVVGVGLIVAALFPYISATDDFVRIEHSDAQHHSHHAGQHQHKTDNLVRLYEAMETGRVCPIPKVALIFFFVSLVLAPTVKAIERIAPFEAGRSPPLAA